MSKKSLIICLNRADAKEHREKYPNDLAVTVNAELGDGVKTDDYWFSEKLKESFKNDNFKKAIRLASVYSHGKERML